MSSARTRSHPTPSGPYHTQTSLQINFLELCIRDCGRWDVEIIACACASACDNPTSPASRTIPSAPVHSFAIWRWACCEQVCVSPQKYFCLRRFRVLGLALRKKALSSQVNHFLRFTYIRAYGVLREEPIHTAVYLAPFKKRNWVLVPGLGLWIREAASLKSTSMTMFTELKCFFS